jgi:ferric-dicitrate binding protein FerR (iron transport regulator)
LLFAASPLVARRSKGKFRTRGRYSAATVRGTRWTVTDRCDGTLTAVARGKVEVRDFLKRKTVFVKTGKTYLARAGRLP